MAAASSALLALLKTFMAVLVVDLAGFGSGKGFVGFCYLNEFLFGRFIASVGCG